MKRVLIITYYWPPSGGSGVQRWLKFAKYLPETGWMPVIYTPENPDFDIRDESLLKDIPQNIEVIKRPIWEPYRLAQIISGKKVNNTGLVKESGPPSLKSRIMTWIRGNLIIPDPRVFWRRPSVRFLKQYLQAHPVDVIITTGPPHSMHLIGRSLKRITGVPWVVDIRDPWSRLDFLDTFLVSPRNRKRYEAMEQSVLRECDAVIATSPSMRTLLMPFDAGKYTPITNGYDEADFATEQQAAATERFTIFHPGLLNELRNPLQLWEALRELCQEQTGFSNDLEVYLAGTIDAGIAAALTSDPVLRKNMRIEGYLSHETVLEAYRQAAVLLLLINNTDNARVNIPGKLFEYLAAGAPQLVLGDPATDAAGIVRELGAGEVCAYSDKTAIKAAVLQLYLDWKSGQHRNIHAGYESYSRLALSRKLAGVLDKLRK